MVRRPIVIQILLRPFRYRAVPPSRSVVRTQIIFSRDPTQPAEQELDSNVNMVKWEAGLAEYGEAEALQRRSQEIEARRD